MGWQKIKSIEEVEYSGEVYNLHVEGNHNYFANNMCVSNCHTFRADRVKGIFETATEVKYRFGMTGSLDKSLTNKMVLRGLIGEVSKVKSTRELIEDGHLSEIKIKCLVLKYSAVDKKIYSDLGKRSALDPKKPKKIEYSDEIEFLCSHKNRNKFITQLALQQTGNTLVLFNHIIHGEALYERLKDISTSHEIHLVCGKIEAEDRENIRTLVQNSEKNNIILGSIGTFSVGVNLPRLHNIIFAHPTRSLIRTVQSIGRGLRKADDKEYLRLFDIADNINGKNFTLKHFAERLQIFVDEDHPYSIINLDLP